MIELVLVISAIVVCLSILALNDFLYHFGVVSGMHGGLLGYGQIHVAKELLEWGGGSLGWVIVLAITVVALAVSIYRVRNTWSSWLSAFNIGILAGILYGGFSLI